MPHELVEPIDETASVEPAEPTAPPVEPGDVGASEDAHGLPPDLIQWPPMQALLAGSPPAVSSVIAEFEKRPEAKIITENKDPLMKAGFNFYRSLDGALGVMFNQTFVSPEQIQQADQAGKLLEVAPPVDSIEKNLTGTGQDLPTDQLEQPEAGGEVPAPPTAGAPPMPASA